MKNAVVSHHYDFQLVPARLLTVNRNYQRDAKAREINKIIANFDYHKVNCVKTVRRDGLYYICDGQQTATALYQKFGPDYLVPCFVYSDIDTSKEEARLLVETNTDIGLGVKLTPNEIWDALLWADDETATKINQIAESHGFSMGSGKKQKHTNHIYAVNAVQSIYKILTEEQFNAVFRIIKGAWGADRDATNGYIIKGLARFVRTYDGKYNETNLIRRLSKHSPLEIIRNGRASFCKGDAKWAREILEIYNNGTSTNRLPDLFA